MKPSKKAEAALYRRAYMYCRGEPDAVGRVQDWARGRAAATGKTPLDCLTARWLYCPEYDPVDNEVGNLPDIA